MQRRGTSSGEGHAAGPAWAIFLLEISQSQPPSGSSALTCGGLIGISRCKKLASQLQHQQYRLLREPFLYYVQGPKSDLSGSCWPAPCSVHGPTPAKSHEMLYASRVTRWWASIVAWSAWWSSVVRTSDRMALRKVRPGNCPLAIPPEI